MIRIDIEASQLDTARQRAAVDLMVFLGCSSPEAQAMLDTAELDAEPTARTYAGDVVGWSVTYRVDPRAGRRPAPPDRPAPLPNPVER